MSPTATKIVDVVVPGAGPVAVRVIPVGGSQDVNVLDKLNLEGVASTIQAIADTLGEAIVKAGPKKASVSFGLEIAVKGGKLISLLTEAGGTATLNVTLEWGG